jgi:hypothetical protein
MNLRIGRIGQLFAWGYSRCLRCYTPWKFVQAHETVVVADYDPLGMRQFDVYVLCQKCWTEAGPDQRLAYYRLAWENRICLGINDRLAWPDVQSAVLNHFMTTK